ncbi:MAG: hypothetical protein DMG62_00570 [Acidobacteria bacterium]|nr:MAG: hypothetical protein DMG62_00570 [Acidobacteriota bacterium]
MICAGAPLIAVFDEWVIQKVSPIIRRVPRDLIRIYGFHDYHCITCSCYQRKPFMGSAYARDVFVEVFDRVRARYRFEVLGYVVMPEHFQLVLRKREKLSLLPEPVSAEQNGDFHVRLRNSDSYSEHNLDQAKQTQD